MNESEEDWALYFDQSRGRKTWSDLHAVALSIVLGEAGIGKTTEFKLEVSRLTSRGEAAFSLPLNMLTDTDSWKIALGDQESAYNRWVASKKQVGYFFLDAVDEARLRSHADFEKALSVVRKALEPNFSRVRITISSRITDWYLPAVQAAIDRLITASLERSLSAIKIVSESEATGDTTTHTPVATAAKVLKPLVVALDPLSISEARRCAEAFDLQEPQKFWATVSEGDYEFMATHPLDLRWMVAIWNKNRTFGTYRELMDANIENRLQEINENYVTSGELLSVEQLRTGAMELAAAAEFGSCPYFILETSVLPEAYELTPQSALTNWKPQEVRRLLATSIFDEASYGRIKFHHRSIREFLAAEWIIKQLKTGVPLLRLQSLFVGRPFGDPVLVPMRKAVLSWLAALNVTAREWVVREFPEVFLYDGDPQGWDAPSAQLAFARCVEASKVGFRPGWHLNASLCRRIGQALPSGVVTVALEDVTVRGEFKALCYQVAIHAKLADCTTVALSDYRDATVPDWQKCLALRLLKQVGTETHRQQVLGYLKAGCFSTNELVAHSLMVVDWKKLTVSELVNIFMTTKSELNYSSDPILRLFKDDLLPETDLASATLLLEAVIAALPPRTQGKRFARFPRSDRPERAWLLDVLPDSFERLLSLLPPTLDTYPAVCVMAAERVETLRDSSFTNLDEFARLQTAIARHPKLRLDIALAIAHSDDIQASISRLIWDSDCLFTIEESDLLELARLAKDASPLPDNHNIWQTLAIEFAFKQTRGHARARALRVLGPFPPDSQRTLLITAKYRSMRASFKSHRTWVEKDQQRKACAASKHAEFKVKVTAHLAGIASGTQGDLIRHLLEHSFDLSGMSDYSNIDFDALSVNLSPEIATALKDGLKAFWRTISPPAPSLLSEGQVPWAAITGLAGLRCSLVEPRAISVLTAIEITKAAQLAVWSQHGPPDWFESLVEAHRSTVIAALSPWLMMEAQAATQGRGVSRTLDMVLGCKTTVRKILLEPLVPLVIASLVPHLVSVKELIKAMREDSLLNSTEVCSLCKSKLTAPAAGELDMFWLRIWMEEDAMSAWAWFGGHIASLNGPTDVEVTAFASAMGDLKWLTEPLLQAQADLLIEVFTLLRAHPTSGTSNDYDSNFFGPPTKRLCQSIAQFFVQVRGSVGHNGLLGLTTKTTDPDELQQLRGQILEHAAMDASRSAIRTVDELHTIASPFLSEPKTEVQLFDQVIARLEEIRKNLEEGPFSERVLFNCGIPEKYLQLWLATKFRETQNRRFSVHREEEVDDDKKTDIQLSCHAGSVCVELKPVDKTRYSAITLTDTLRNQIVGQYLKGTNSSCGILILLQLDDKRWDIPGGAKRQPFSALVEYLSREASVIKAESPGVKELVVFGMRCFI